jgi:hypothetical protein
MKDLLMKYKILCYERNWLTTQASRLSAHDSHVSPIHQHPAPSTQPCEITLKHRLCTIHRASTLHLAISAQIFFLQLKNNCFS